MPRIRTIKNGKEHFYDTDLKIFVRVHRQHPQQSEFEKKLNKILTTEVYIIPQGPVTFFSKKEEATLNKILANRISKLMKFPIYIGHHDIDTVLSNQKLSNNDVVQYQVLNLPLNLKDTGPIIRDKGIKNFNVENWQKIESPEELHKWLTPLR